MIYVQAETSTLANLPYTHMYLVLTQFFEYYSNSPPHSYRRF